MNVTAYVTQPCTRQWPNVTASLTLCMNEVSERSRCLLETETQRNSLWVPQQGPLFIRRDDVIYGCPVLTLFMCALDFRGSAEGVTDTIQ
jgi:hypothetical protein